MQVVEAMAAAQEFADHKRHPSPCDDFRGLGHGAELSNRRLETLHTSLRGVLIGTEDPEYDTARRIWNGMIDRHPAAIARCLGVADILAALKFAREHGLSVSIRSGGRNIAGLAVNDGSLMIDLSWMRGVLVDPATRTAHAQAGCLLSDVDRETQIHGLAAVLGFVSLSNSTFSP